ncbi:MAG: hypothetical protein JO257_06420 [Deltaproteobacteria bacterium]|nr:hypothetical protein [Deltaproteobacteria bacterium]
MRALLILVAMGTTASADPWRFTSWDEIGVLRTRLDMADGYAVTGEAVRFAPHVPIGPNVYIGAELDTGSLSGRVPSDATYRSSTGGGEQVPTAAATGKYGAVRALIGVRMRFGMLSVAGEFAAGLHAADLQDAYGQEISATHANSTELEGRARVDLWVSPRLTVGAIAGVGLDDSRDATAGLMLGYHFGNYDGMR